MQIVTALILLLLTFQFLDKNKPKKKTEGSESDNAISKLEQITSLDSIAEFLNFYSTLENDWMDEENYEFEAFKNELMKKEDECNDILSTVSIKV